MTSLGLVYTLLSGVSWALFDTSRKGLLAHLGPLPSVVWLMLGQVPLFALWWAVTLKHSTLAWTYASPGLAAVVLNVVASLLFLESLRLAPLSRMVPLLSLTPVLTTVTGFVALGEWPTALQLAGVALVALGAWVLSRGSDREAEREGHETRRGALLMLGVAITWSVTAALDKVALRSASPAFHGLVQTSGIGLVVLAMLAWQRRLGELRPPGPAGRWLVAGVLTSGAAMGLQFVALGQVLVTLFEATKRAVGMTLALALGRALFDEGVTWGKTLSVLIMAVGVTLVLL
jgi:drug/metabolite transporter (DMT)-like permease